MWFYLKKKFNLYLNKDNHVHFLFENIDKLNFYFKQLKIFVI